MKNSSREHWNSSLMFILAAAGSAIGLGNIWKYPYIAGENGGFAFTLVYLGCVFIIGLPLVIGELIMGRMTQLNPVGAYKAADSGNGRWWYAGLLGVISGFVILSFYSVVAGWSLHYIFKSALGQLDVLTDSAVAGEVFSSFSSSPSYSIFWHAVFMSICVFVVSQGVKSGLQRCNEILMPLLLVILLILVGRSLTLPGAGAGVSFLWSPDFSKLNGEVILLALGHAFFTVSLGMGAMMTYGSYLDEKKNIPSMALVVVVADTIVALLAGLAIFPAVFATGGEPAAGPSLIFITLPVVFNHLPLGGLLGTCFFIFLTIAALTSAISLLEVVTAYFVDEKDWSRVKASVLSGITIFFLGVPSCLSFGPWAQAQVGGKTFFDWMDYLASNICLPLGGLLLAIFIGWRLSRHTAIWQFRLGNGLTDFAGIWYFTIRYPIPILMLIILLTKIFNIV